MHLEKKIIHPAMIGHMQRIDKGVISSGRFAKK